MINLQKDLHTHTTVKPVEGAGGALSLSLSSPIKIATKTLRHKVTQKGLL